MHSNVPEKHIYIRDVGRLIYFNEKSQNTLILKCCEPNNSQLTLEHVFRKQIVSVMSSRLISVLSV